MSVEDLRLPHLRRFFTMLSRHSLEYFNHHEVMMLITTYGNAALKK